MNVRSIATTAFTLLAFAATSNRAFGDEPRCHKVHARLELAASTEPGCTSPIGLCATGELRGSLSGNSDFLGSSFVPTVDTATTAVVILTGDNVIHTRRGDLYTKDAVVLSTVGDGDFAEVDTIVGGTDDYEGATGTLTATGVFANGVGNGTLDGVICRP